MPLLLSVNAAQPLATEHTSAPSGLTGIDKRPVSGPVAVSAPGPAGSAGSGVAGDFIGSLKHHGGDDQAVYAYAREDLDHWADELGRELPGGCFGENLTTQGIDVNDTRVGERWRIGTDLVLEATAPRVPCRTFASRLREDGWVKTFTRAARPGAYFRVIEPGEIRAGDVIEVLHRPDHEVSVAFFFRARTLEPALRPRVAAAGAALRAEHLEWAAGAS